MRFSSQEHWSELPCSPSGDIPDAGIRPTSHVSGISSQVLYHYRHLGSPNRVVRSATLVGTDRKILSAAAKSLQLCPTLCDPIDGSLPGSSVHGILQTRTLEWVAISSSNAWKWKVKVKSLSHVWLLVTPWTAAYQAPPSMGFSRQEYWSGVPLPSPRGDIWAETWIQLGTEPSDSLRGNRGAEEIAKAWAGMCLTDLKGSKKTVEWVRGRRGQGPDRAGFFRSWHGPGCILGFIPSTMGCHCGAFPHVSSNSLIRSGVATSNAYRHVMRVQVLWVGVTVLLQLIMAMQECKTNQCFQRSLLTNENVDIEMFMWKTSIFKYCKKN